MATSKNTTEPAVHSDWIQYSFTSQQVMYTVYKNNSTFKKQFQKKKKMWNNILLEEMFDFSLQVVTEQGKPFIHTEVLSKIYMILSTTREEKGNSGWVSLVTMLVEGSKIIMTRCEKASVALVLAETLRKMH